MPLGRYAGMVVASLVGVLAVTVADILPWAVLSWTYAQEFWVRRLTEHLLVGSALYGLPALVLLSLYKGRGPGRWWPAILLALFTVCLIGTLGYQALSLAFRDVLYWGLQFPLSMAGTAVMAMWIDERVESRRAATA